jgi:hypothetical protein
MTRRFNRIFGSVVAGLTAVVYAGLVCLAATCSLAFPVSAHADGHGSSHHHDAAHSPLCAWACQATSENGLVASAPTDVAESAVFVSPERPPQSVSLASVSCLPSRAPPLCPFG